MSVYFSITDEGPAFYLTRKLAPAGAVKITDARHGQLLEALGEGHSVVAGKGGKPAIKKAKADIATLRADAVRRVKAEAKRRIVKVAPIWRQINDMRFTSPEGEARFAQIDAIRAASDEIEAFAADLTAAQLRDYDIAKSPFWPEID